MARPVKNNCEYYPHFTTMRNHRKVKALRNKFGHVLGYAFWAMFTEYLTELDGNEFELNNIECEMFAAELGVSAAEIPPMINYCLEIELLFKTEDNFIYSESLNENLKPVYDKRNNERSKSKTRKRRENGSFCKQINHELGVSAAEIPQSKVKYSKVNKIELYKEQFELFRKKYEGTKRGLETEFKDFQKHKDWEKVLTILEQSFDKIKLNREFKKAKGEFVPEWKNLKTWINQRCWEEAEQIEKTIELTKSGPSFRNKTFEELQA